MTPTPSVLKALLVVPAENGAPCTSLKAGAPNLTLVVYTSTAPAVTLPPEATPEATPESAMKRYCPLGSKAIWPGEPPGVLGSVMAAEPARAVRLVAVVDGVNPYAVTVLETASAVMR